MQRHKQQGVRSHAAAHTLSASRVSGASTAAVGVGVAMPASHRSALRFSSTHSARPLSTARCASVVGKSSSLAVLHHRGQRAVTPSRHGYRKHTHHTTLRTLSTLLSDTADDSIATTTTKHSLRQPLAAEYNPDDVEATWDTFWEHHDLYKPNRLKSPSFSMVLPPPNVTGSLHLGHALTIAIQDSIVRYHRMNGKDVLWVPGLDHAGIATQVVVEKQLKKLRNLSRHDLGREAFVDQIWEWKRTYGGHIFDQMRHLGASVDWSRQRFTLDPTCQAAVVEAFTQLHQKDVIYRDNRLVSWSCALKSAISSIEVDHIEVEGPTMLRVPGHDKEVEVGVLHSFAYKVKGSSTGEEVVVATTRIETMLGDVAVAVHPDDPRYAHLHHKTLVHPFDPTREVVVVPDAELVDMSFGTGAVKITPGHDPNDYACGLRHGLPQLTILTDDGHMNDTVPEQYRGAHRFAVREDIVKHLDELGLYRGKEANPMSVSVCSRSGDLIEPLIKPQWWVRCDTMAKQGLAAVDSGELTILPSTGTDAWKRWLENIQDWCISRQLWWGHRVPAYYVLPHGETWPIAPDREDKSRWIIAASADEAMDLAKKKFPQDKGDPTAAWTLHQDEDVLDTWFSSGLFPFAVMGWPTTDPAKAGHDDYARYFPNKLLETGSDILFFWVARMVMLSQELTGKLPFDTVYLHSLVRDKFGRKMSKSLGNVVDPIDVIKGSTLDQLAERLAQGNLHQEEIKRARATQQVEFPQGIPRCGADALRFGLLTYTKQGGDINLDMNVIVSARHFGNKMWQATRFALMNFPQDFVPPHRGLVDVQRDIANAPGGIAFEQQWILNKLYHTTRRVHEAYTNYEFAQATQCLQSFFVDDLCSRYLEIIKPVVRRPLHGNGAAAADNDNDIDTSYNHAAAQSALSVLHYSMDCFFRLLHPMMPFITEELWHRLPGHAALHKDAMASQYHVEYGSDSELNNLYHQHQQQPGAVANMVPQHARVGDIVSENKRLRSGSIMVAAFPQTEDLSAYNNPTVDATMGLLTTIIDKIRMVKARLGLPNHYRPQVFLECQAGGPTDDDDGGDAVTPARLPLLDQLTPLRQLISTLSFVATPHVFSADQRDAVLGPRTTIRQFISSDVLLHLVLDGSIDFSTELVKNERKLEEITTQRETLLVTIERTQDNPKVKDEVKAKNAAMLTHYTDELVILGENIAAYRQVVTPANYVREKTKDLHHELEVVEKTKEKMAALVANAKKPSPKHIDALQQCEVTIIALNARLAELAAGGAAK